MAVTMTTGSPPEVWGGKLVDAAEALLEHNPHPKNCGCDFCGYRRDLKQAVNNWYKHVYQPIEVAAMAARACPEGGGK